MYKIGIDIGSTYTKYCIMNEGRDITELFSEKTPIRQKEFFEAKLMEIMDKFPSADIVSCGYGKKNIQALKNINELTALALGGYFLEPDSDIILDIGGQDTKIIRQENGRLKEFFINGKCAAGSGMFLANVLRMLEKDFWEIDLTGTETTPLKLSSVCAVFASSEIVTLLADNVNEDDIIKAVIWHILIQAKLLLKKVKRSKILLSGGFTKIPGFCKYAENALECECVVAENGSYLSAIGCALMERN